MTTRDKIRQLLNPLPHKLKVIFAIFCANDIKHLMNEESIYCLELTEKWLKDNTSVSNDELKRAAYATNASAHASAYNAAAYAADAAAYAADAAAYAADAAAYAAAAYSAAYAAAYAAKIEYYYNHLITMTKNLSTFEKIMWEIKC